MIVFVRENDFWTANFDFGSYGNGHVRVSLKGVGKTQDDARTNFLSKLEEARFWLAKFEDN
ncbi:MAG: hypothetical protein AAGD43_26180 [Pseudomonadota bacterium]